MPEEVQIVHHSAVEAFPPEVISELKTYVYRLIDPRNGETFYVGKGRGNRVFAHIREQVSDDDVEGKLGRIRDIRLSGFEVAHVIHRHGLDDRTAFEVEAALIDAYPGLTNVVGGAGSGDYGVMHAGEVISKYRAEPAVFEHLALLINVSKTATERTLYEAVRFAWRINREKAEQAQVILATRDGIIVGAYVADQWLDATEDNFPGRETVQGRIGFVGRRAPDEYWQQYVRKRVPARFRKPGAANPVRYSWG